MVVCHLPSLQLVWLHCPQGTCTYRMNRYSIQGFAMFCHFSLSLSLPPLSLSLSLSPPFFSSGRRHFEYERQEVQPIIQRPQTQPSGQTDLRDEEVSSSSSSEEVGKEASESPPTQLKDEERREIFASRQRLSKLSKSNSVQILFVFLVFSVRTPPKHQNTPFQPPPGAGDEATPPHRHNDDHHQPDPQQQQYTRTPHPSSAVAASELNRVQILQVCHLSLL